MPPTSQQRWGGKGGCPPRSLATGSQPPAAAGKSTWAGAGGGGGREHPGWAVSPVPVPRGDPKARSPPRSWGGEELPGLRGEVEGPAGATGETERRPRVGLPSRRAKGGGGSRPPATTSAPWGRAQGLWDPPRCGGRGAPGQGTQPGLSSPQLPGGQKCPFRRSGSSRAVRNVPLK